MAGHKVPPAEVQAKRLIDNAIANASYYATQAAASFDGAMDAAAASQDTYDSGVQAAVQKKSFSRGIRRVDRGAAKALITAQGATIYSNGISSREAKILASRRRLQPLQQAVVDKIATMPRKSVADAKARMGANFDAQVALGDAYRGV
jgi:hypothetical protein